MNNLFQVTQTPRSLHGLVTVTVTPYMRGYAKHNAIAYAIAIIGWLLYSHPTTTNDNNDNTTIDEVVFLRQGHIETTCNNNYITNDISAQNEHQNTSNILTADNITSNTVIKSVEELPLADIESTAVDAPSTVITLVNNNINNNNNNNKQGSIGYIKYWLGGFLMLMITAIPWDHSSVVIQVLVDTLCISIMIITTVKMMTLVYTLLKGASRGIDQVLEWIVAAADECINNLRLAKNVSFDTHNTVLLIPIKQDVSWSIDMMAKWNYFQRRYIHLFVKGWHEEMQQGLLHPDLGKILVDMEKWYDIDEINNFLALYEVLCSNEVKEARLQHTTKLTRVHRQLKSGVNAAVDDDDDDTIDFGRDHDALVEDAEDVEPPPILCNFRVHPRNLSEAEKKEDIGLVQQAWTLLYNDNDAPPKENKLQFNDNKMEDVQDIAGREEAEISIDFLESFRYLIDELQQAAPAKFEKGSPLELRVRKCNAFHLLEDVIRLEEDLRALEQQVKKEKRLEKLEKKLQSDLVGWDVPQGRSRRIRKQRVIFSPAA